MKKTLAVSWAALALGILTLSQIAVGMQVTDRVNPTPARGSVTVLQTLCLRKLPLPLHPLVEFKVPRRIKPVLWSHPIQSCNRLRS